MAILRDPLPSVVILLRGAKFSMDSNCLEVPNVPFQLLNLDQGSVPSYSDLVPSHFQLVPFQLKNFKNGTRNGKVENGSSSVSF